MALVNSVIGLSNAVTNKVGALTSVAKGIMCLPSILSGLPGIAGNVAKSVLSSLQNQALGIAAGIANSITDLINSAICQLVNPLEALLKLQADILATIGVVLATILAVKKQVEDLLNFRANQENCRFAAAELSKCVVGSILSDLNKTLIKNAKAIHGINACGVLTGAAAAKLAKPGNVIEKYTSKISNSVDKATNQIKTSKLI